MENTVQALKIGAAMLVFSIALATTFMVFAQAKQVSEAVFIAIDNDSFAEYIEGNGSKYRVVGLETIIPTLYKYHKELYSVTILDKAGNKIENFDVANEVLDASRLMKRLDKFVKELLDNTSLKNSKFEESFVEYEYKGNSYTDPITGETINSINTQTKIDITYKVI